MAVFTRSLAGITAVLIIAAVAHVNILSHGGYGSPFSYVTAAVALGVIVGSLAIGQCTENRRFVVASLLIAFIAFGEAFAFVNTAERVIASRDEKQAPLRQLEDQHKKAQARFEAAQAALAAIPATTERITRAEAAKAAADAAVIERSSQRTCASNCRQLLQQQVDNASRELAEARAELAARRAAAEAEVVEARAALGSFRAVATASPLADRLGLEPWVLDVATSALASTSANGFACVLLIFSAHGGRRRELHVIEAKAEAEAVQLKPTEPELKRVERPRPQPATKRIETARDQAARFGVECMRPGGEVALSDINRAYRSWCESRGHVQFPSRQIAQALADLFDEAGLDLVERDGKRVVVGASLVEPPRKALGHMVSVGKVA